MALLRVDLEIRVVWADCNLGTILVEGEGRDWADVELVHVGSHWRAERRRTGRGGSPLSATDGARRTGDEAVDLWLGPRDLLNLTATKEDRATADRES